MSYTSFVYLVLISFTVLFYYVFPQKARWIVLLAANMAFYIYSGWDHFVFLMASVAISYFTARKISETSDKKKRKRYLTAGLAAVLGILIAVKYLNFMLGNVFALIRLFRPAQETLTLKLIVPMGVSFYTFQMVSYLMDIYRGKAEVQTNFCKYVLYASFFPSVVQGPIPRYSDLGEQLYRGNEFKYENIRNGALLILWGFFKKLVLAERLNLFVGDIYGNYEAYRGLILVIATAAYSIQVYADFSGCMDIVSGTAKLFGIQLAPNFLRPYFSKTLPEFWRRWHVTMGTWFKDYVFFPISISKTAMKLNKKARKAFGNAAGRNVAACFPLAVVWLLTGIWHGASWNFVAWGMFHGILIMLSQVCGPYIEKWTQRLPVRKESFGFRLFQMVRTFTICCIGRVFFRARSFKEAIRIFIRIFSGVGMGFVRGGQLYVHGLNKANLIVVLIAILVLWIVSMLQERMNVTEALFGKPLVIRWALIYLLILAVFVFGKYGPGYEAADFIYEQF